MATRRLAEILRQITVLTAEAAELVRSLESVAEDEPPPVRARKGRRSKREKRTLMVGDMVTVTRADEYQGREGMVTARRGAMFLWVRLSATEEEPEVEIYKMRHNLKRLKAKE